MNTITWVPRLIEEYQPIEIRPSIRTVTFVEHHRDILRRKERKYRLAFPFMQFFRNHESMKRVTWSLKSVSSLEDEVSIPLLPNVSSNGWACCRGKTSLDFCMKFWQTQFTINEMVTFYQRRDSVGVNYLQKSTLKSFEHWEKLTLQTKHPLDVFEGFCSHIVKFKNFFRHENEFHRLWDTEVEIKPL